MDEYRKYEPIFGSWKLEREIGKGSFSKVFEISREEFGVTQRAALKIINVPQAKGDIKIKMNMGADPAATSEYSDGPLTEVINEKEIMAQLKGDSNIVSYEDHQIIPREDGGHDVLIRMELLTPLLDRLIKEPLDEKGVVKLGIDICKALEACQRKNIIHRDVKPQNIFISENGDFKLGDFGIAKKMDEMADDMSKKGTVKYMAPEVFHGENYDSKVDIYSLGIVLYSLLNGNRGPFLPDYPAKVTPADEEEAKERRFRGEELPAPKDAGTMLAYIIKKACAADPAARYQTAEQMRHDLENYLTNYIAKPDGGHEEATPSYNAPAAASGYAATPQSQAAPQYGAAAPMSGGIASASSGNATPAQPYIAPVQGNNAQAAPRPIPLERKSASKMPFIIAAAVILLAVGIFLVVKYALPGAGTDCGTGGSGECGGPPVDTVEPVRMSNDTEGVTVLSSDWDWDSSDEDADCIYVDDILWVKNDSEYPIVGIEFSVCDENGNQMVNTDAETGTTFTAYGYIPAGQEGIMSAYAGTPAKVKHDDSTYKVTSVIINESLGDYEVPTGKLVGYSKDDDSYDAEITNGNDTEVSEGATVVTAEFKDGKIFDADATGRLSAPIGPNTEGSFHDACFTDPNFYAKPKFENKTVYVLDTEKYGLESL